MFLFTCDCGFTIPESGTDDESGAKETTILSRRQNITARRYRHLYRMTACTGRLGTVSS
jgi:hypothetical protein